MDSKIDQVGRSDKSSYAIISYSEDKPTSDGHSFSIRTFYQPSYCDHCKKLLWGLYYQGYECSSNIYSSAYE
jgi:hypothetical protein